MSSFRKEFCDIDVITVDRVIGSFRISDREVTYFERSSVNSDLGAGSQIIGILSG